MLTFCKDLPHPTYILTSILEEEAVELCELAKIVLAGEKFPLKKKQLRERDGNFARHCNRKKKLPSRATGRTE
jgi:hypothetical protein